MADIALFGSTGMIGQRILNEALRREHKVTAIVRDAARAPLHAPNLNVKTGDVLKPESVALAARGNFVVVSAYGPGNGDPAQLVTAAKSLLEGVGERNITEKMFAFGSADFTHDQLQQLTLQSIYTGGLGDRFAPTPR